MYNYKESVTTRSNPYEMRIFTLNWFNEIAIIATMLMAFTFKFFTEVLFLSIILCLANTGIVNVLVSTLYSKPDEVTGYECGLYSTKGGRLKDRISFYTVGLTMMIFDVEVVLTFKTSIGHRTSSKPKSSSKLITNPISPETSTNENPMKAYRNNSSRCDGFLPMDISNEP